MEDLLKQAEGLDWFMDTGTVSRDDDPLLRDTYRPSFRLMQASSIIVIALYSYLATMQPLAMHSFLHSRR